MVESNCYDDSKVAFVGFNIHQMNGYSLIFYTKTTLDITVNKRADVSRRITFQSDIRISDIRKKILQYQE